MVLQTLREQTSRKNDEKQRTPKIDAAASQSLPGTAKAGTTGTGGGEDPWATIDVLLEM